MLFFCVFLFEEGNESEIFFPLSSVVPLFFLALPPSAYPYRCRLFKSRATACIPRHLFILFFSRAETKNERGEFFQLQVSRQTLDISLNLSTPPPLFEKRKEKEEKLTLSPPRTPAGTRATAPACPPSPRSAPSLLRGGASSTSASSAAPRRRRRRPRSASAGPPGPATGRGGPWRPWRR